MKEQTVRTFCAALNKATWDTPAKMVEKLHLFSLIIILSRPLLANASALLMM